MRERQTRLTYSDFFSGLSGKAAPEGTGLTERRSVIRVVTVVMATILDSGATDTDLRRALLLYLLGFGFYLFATLLEMSYFVASVAADPTTGDPRPPDEFLMVGMWITSTFIMVSSQLWYLRTKHVWRSRNHRRFVTGAVPEVLVVLVTAAAAVLKIAQPLPVTTASVAFLSFWLLYLPVILSWNAKRGIENIYPELSTRLRTLLSVAFGIFLTFVYVTVVLIVFSSLG